MFFLKQHLNHNSSSLKAVNVNLVFRIYNFYVLCKLKIYLKHKTNSGQGIFPISKREKYVRPAFEAPFNLAPFNLSTLLSTSLTPWPLFHTYWLIHSIMNELG